MVIERPWKRWVYFYIPLTLFIIGTLFPFYWMLITAIRPDAELYRSWRAVNNAPRAIELRVGSDGGDEHPVERKERADDEERERDVEVHPPLPRPLDDHLSRAPDRVEPRVA